VAQRTRELALLRAIGATRRQVRRSVIAEALVIGLLASVVGLALGVGLAQLLVLMLGQTGVEMTAPGIGDVGLRTVLISVLVGTVITVVASLAPASKATRVAPIEALRESVPGGYRFSPRRAVAGAVVTAAGLAALAAGLYGGAALAVVGLGAVVTFLGITVLLPLLSRVLARALGAPLPRLAGMTGKLARDNAMRNPKRTASTGRRPDDRAGPGRECQRPGVVAQGEPRLRHRADAQERARPAAGGSGVDWALTSLEPYAGPRGSRPSPSSAGRRSRSKAS
jgi:putative ABC transport system permease protein